MGERERGEVGLWLIGGIGDRGGDWFVRLRMYWRGKGDGGIVRDDRHTASSSLGKIDVSACSISRNERTGDIGFFEIVFV